jgi:hypothetical protein
MHKTYSCKAYSILSLTHSSSSGARPRGPRSSPLSVAGLCTLDVDAAVGAVPFVPALGLFCVGVLGCEGVSPVDVDEGGGPSIITAGSGGSWGGVMESCWEVGIAEVWVRSRMEVEFEMFVIAGASSCRGIGADVSGAASPSALMDDIGLLTPGVVC